MARSSPLLILLFSLLGGCFSIQAPQKFDPVAAARARAALALEYLHGGDLVAAQHNLEMALQYHPRSLQVQLVMALYQQSIGEYSAAERHYRCAIQIAPESGEVHNNYGVLLSLTGKWEEAQRQFAAAIAASGYPHRSRALYNSGLCYLRSGDLANANFSLCQAVKHDPSLREQLRELAREAFARGAIDQAQLFLAIYVKARAPKPATARLHYRTHGGG